MPPSETLQQCIISDLSKVYYLINIKKIFRCIKKKLQIMEIIKPVSIWTNFLSPGAKELQKMSCNLTPCAKKR